MFIIYKITNKSTGKSYIGVTKQSVERRWYQHQWFAKHKPTSRLHKAIAKYGPNEFIIKILLSEQDDSKRVLLEQQLIQQHNTYVNGYNSTRGGEDFTDTDYQRELQKNRVNDGSHPFLGGEIQKAVGKRRWEDGTNPLIGLNQKRILEGSHNFVGDNNPQRRLAAAGEHHNQTTPWNNTKVTPEALRAWSIADQLYSWYLDNKDNKRCGPHSMAAAFNLNCSLQVMYYKYFKQGWNPLEDYAWMNKFRSKT